MVDTYVINLDRSPQRWAAISLRLQQFPQLRVHRINAVDGQYLPEVPVRKSFVCPALSSGTLGCYLSHLSAWKTVRDSGAPYALILEDDVVLHESIFTEILTALCRPPIRTIWDICSFQLNHRGWPVPMAKLGEHQLCAYLTCITGAGAYLVNQKAVQSLIQHAYPIFMPVDHYYTKSHKLKLRFTGIEPRIAWQPSADSVIEAMGRERRRQLSGVRRVLFSAHRVWAELCQGCYAAFWSLPQYFKR